ncbi:phosphoinositide 3-kinase regulatory subunit 5-like [Acipenser ruthenus]|uniref:phosphoinositide 3-kinase regulatory subunit 5-like n=1 Tax=Acipenser ruthenus TaxID=7906 RepID=UPI0027419006|nr:phosphoinositide 3-kinase regulatory subunit 5-like [Acipenser ruthenus]XP_033894153.3 phosphoinositide 3-kinase regulatory subunit 5-like [Acipenser ruthenus]
MQHTSCTEDRIHHALQRCLHGLGRDPFSTDTWTVGLCMNRWSLEELVNRDPGNFLILLQQILKRTREVQVNSEYVLVAPLALMFFSTLLRTPFFPPDCTLLKEACEIYHSFLTWPEPYCSVCRDLLTFIHQELKAPGISYQRLVREEQGLTTENHPSKTITVLLMNPADVPKEYLSIADQLSTVEHSQRDSYITLIKHAYQCTFGTKYSLKDIQKTLESKELEELVEIFSASTEILETASALEDSVKSREFIQGKLGELREKAGIPAENGNTPAGEKSSSTIQTLPLPIAKCHTYHWDKDNFDVLNEILCSECDLPVTTLAEPEEEELDDEEEDIEDEVEINNHRASTFSTTSKDSMFSTYSLASNCSMPSALSVVSGVDSDFCEDMDEDSRHEKQSKAKPKLKKRISMLFKSKSSQSLRRTESLGNPESKNNFPVKSRSNSLPQQVCLMRAERQSLKTTCFRRRPFLSCDDDSKATTLRVVVFGADQISGKVARAYSNLRLQESGCPRLTRYFRLQFYFVPVKRNSSCPAVPGSFPNSVSDSPMRPAAPMDLNPPGLEDSTNDIARYIGMLDPWYDRNILSLLSLPIGVLCQQASKIETDSFNNSKQRLPILADMVLYYCRHATHTALVQLYQAELTLAGGERRTEVFIHSLELGHTAGTRAIKASGPGSKRFGIDGEREAVPLTLGIVYSKVSVSSRRQWNNIEKVCTSVNLTKACRRPEELDSKMECLQLTMTEVLKRQNSKSKMGYNQQMNTTQVKVDKVQVTGSNSTTFAVCFDQDEKKILQSVTRCEVSVCYKPENSILWRFRRKRSFQEQPPHPEFCSLLCLPISTFSGALP